MRRNFLSDAYVNKEVRFSAFFSEFLFSKDARHGHELMTQGQFQDASCILLNCYRIAEKLYSLEDPVAFVTVCLVIASLNACDDVKQAQKYAETALTAVSIHHIHEYPQKAILACRIKDLRVMFIFPGAIPSRPSGYCRAFAHPLSAAFRDRGERSFSNRQRAQNIRRRENTHRQLANPTCHCASTRYRRVLPMSNSTGEQYVPLANVLVP